MQNINALLGQVQCWILPALHLVLDRIRLLCTDNRQSELVQSLSQDIIEGSSNQDKTIREMPCSIPVTLEGSSNIVLTPVNMNTSDVTVAKQHAAPVEMNATLRVSPSSILFFDRERELEAFRLPLKCGSKNGYAIMEVLLRGIKTTATETETVFTEDTRSYLIPAEWEFGIAPIITVTEPTPPLHRRNCHPPMHIAVQWVGDRVPMITITPPSPLPTHLWPNKRSLSSLLLSDSDTEVSIANQHSHGTGEGTG